MSQKRLSGDKEIVGYHSLEIDIVSRGGVVFVLSPCREDYNKSDAYKKKAWHKTYVSDAGRVVVYATSHEKKVFSDDAIIALLRDWKTGLWIHTDMRRKPVKVGAK